MIPSQIVSEICFLLLSPVVLPCGCSWSHLDCDSNLLFLRSLSSYWALLFIFHVATNIMFLKLPGVHIVFCLKPLLSLGVLRVWPAPQSSASHGAPFFASSPHSPWASGCTVNWRSLTMLGLFLVASGLTLLSTWNVFPFIFAHLPKPAHNIPLMKFPLHSSISSLSASWGSGLCCHPN